MITVLCDVHIGAQRSAGTTHLTAFQLRQNLLSQFASLLDEGGDTIILGDLFDTGHIAMADVLATWKILRQHLGAGHRLWLVNGNHDLEKNLTLLSSFQFLCKLLEAEFPQLVKVIAEPALIGSAHYVIPHLPNQDLFDAALAVAPTCKYLYVHCNYDNNFAVESDHSLNMSKEQAQAAKAEMVIFAHEHQHRKELGGKVLVIGNQFPSSVADCLGNDRKFKLEISGTEPWRLVPTWQAAGDYCEMDWQDLQDNGCRFIRVIGAATAAQAGDVVQAISKFRSKSKALVITNATSVEGAAGAEQIQLNMEEVQAFDVWEALLECLDEREQGIIKALYRPST